MAGLTNSDIEILKEYADSGNRLLYWNYLARLPGNDGYGVLALGVVRNDNMPGATANSYAQAKALDLNHRSLSEREWERFGVDLMQQDLKFRNVQMKLNRPDLALNLPVEWVQKSHDGAFEKAGITPDAWTPRQLLEAARRHGGEPAAEHVWHNMLDSAMLGGPRLGKTMQGLWATYNDDEVRALPYSWDLFKAWAAAGKSRPQTDPNVIGNQRDYHMRSGQKPEWIHVSGSATDPVMNFSVADKAEAARLEDARAVRLERQHKATQFDPRDPYRALPLVTSPITMAEATPPHSPIALSTQLPGMTRSTAAAPGSTDDLFTRLTDAALARDIDGMRGVEKEFTTSPAGQQWLQTGREYNQQQQQQQQRESELAAQQAQAAQSQATQAALQAAAPPQPSAPAMRM